MFGALRPSALELMPSSFSGHERNHLFVNRGGSQFADVSGVSGLDHDGDARASALLDYDRDGWLDIVAVNANQPLLQLFRNQIPASIAAPGGMIAVRFVGGNRSAARSETWSNRDGVGALVTVTTDRLTLIREQRAGEGFAAQNSGTMLVGIGAADAATALTVRWPSGQVQAVGRVPSGSVVTVYENPADAPGGTPAVIAPYRTSAPRGPSARRLSSVRFPGTRLEIPGAQPATGLRLFTTMTTWCPFCKFWQTQVRALAAAFGDDELHLFGVPVDPTDTRAMLDEYMQRDKPGYTLLAGLAAADVARMTNITTPLYGADLLPTTVVTDTAGHVLLTTDGIPSVSVIRRLLYERIGARPGAAANPAR